MRELGSEFVAELFSYDAKIWQTLAALVRRPGLLTAEYLVGRRVRYLRPLRLYLSASLVYFLVFGFRLQGGWSPVTVNRTPASAPARATADVGPNALRGGWFERTMRANMRRIDRMTPAEHARVFGDGLARRFPNAMFVLMPVFALVLRMLYLRSGRRYAEHFVFALHVHAFAFAVSAAMLLAPSRAGPVLVPATALWIAAYAALAMRRVYGESRRRTALKFAALLGLYVPMLFATMLALLVITILTLD